MNNEQGQFDVLDIMAIINFILNITSVSNDQVLKELKFQDREYLSKLNEKLDKIIEYIEGGKNEIIFSKEDVEANE